MRRTVLAVAFALTCLPLGARAGQACTEKSLGPGEVRAALELALDTRQALDRDGARIALAARVGRDLSRYGLRYSHVGIAWRDHPRGAWTIVEELNACGTATSDLYDDGLGNFVLDDMFAYETKLVVPSPQVQQRIAAALAAGTGRRLHEDRYSLVAYPYSIRYQNSNQWVLETIAAALDDRPIANRADAQAWLRAHDYRPTTLHLTPFERLGAEVFRANVAFDDHPIDRRMAGAIDVVSAESVLDFVRRADPRARAIVISVAVPRAAARDR